MSQFHGFQLKDFLVEGLDKLGFTKPTPIQGKAIPAILSGQDLIGQSHTGTGKTLAYVLPLLEKIDVSKHQLQALILAPTRELIGQIAATIEQLTGESGIDVLLIQGGVQKKRQIQIMERNPQIIVGTPGRVIDLINQGKLASHTAKLLVIDEADTMLEMGFMEEIEKVLQKLKRDIQIVLFAATLPQKVAALAKSFMKKPQHIDVNQGQRALPAIENVVFKVRSGGKEETIVNLVKLYNPYLAIVFAKKKEQVDGLVTELRQAGVEADGLHGDMERGQRKRVMQRFREAKSQVLVATDIASRGLDVEGITHIFNFDIPISVDQYVHRIGRTGRAGESGIAVNIIVDAEEDKLRYIANKLEKPFKEKSISKGVIVDKSVRRKDNEEKAETKPKAKQNPKVTTKKFTGPNAKKKSLKEMQQRKGKKVRAVGKGSSTGSSKGKR